MKRCPKGHVVKKLVAGVCSKCYYAERTRIWRDKNPRQYTETDRIKDRAYRQTIRAALKQTVIEALGGKCECCKEKQLGFLCVDHKNGGGRKHREQFGSSSVRFYYWLIRQINDIGLVKVLKQFRVLCWNCNSAYHFLGYCPHQRKTTK